MGGLAVIWAPVRTLASVAEERRVLLGFVIVALSAALGLIFESILVFSGLIQAQLEAQFEAQQLPPEFGVEDFLVYFNVFSLISAVLSPFISWLLVSGLMQLITRFFGGTGPFSGMLAVVGVAQVPPIILSVVQFPVTLLQGMLGSENPATTILMLVGGLIGLVSLFWYIALVVIGAAFARRVGYGQSAGSCAISCAGCVGLILVVVVVLALVAVFVVGVASGPS